MLQISPIDIAFEDRLECFSIQPFDPQNDKTHAALYDCFLSHRPCFLKINEDECRVQIEKITRTYRIHPKSQHATIYFRRLSAIETSDCVIADT